MRSSNKLMTGLALFILIMAPVACGSAMEPETDTHTRTLTFVLTGSMRECDYFSHTNETGGSNIIDNCMVPFHVTVEVPEFVSVHVTAGKKPEGNLTVMVIEDGTVIGYDIAGEGDTEAQWIED